MKRKIRWLLYNISPKSLQTWWNRRVFWRRLEEAAYGDGGVPSLLSALACAEMNRRLGDDSLCERIRRTDTGFRWTYE